MRLSEALTIAVRKLGVYTSRRSPLEALGTLIVMLCTLGDLDVGG